MENIDRDELQWRIAMIYILVAVAFLTWYLVSQIMIAAGAIVQPDPEWDLYRLIFGVIALNVGIIRLRWKDMKYPKLGN